MHKLAQKSEIPRRAVSRLAKVTVKPGLGRHLRTGHPWLYRRGVAEAPDLPPGAVVDVLEDGKFAARGYFDPLSSIAVRVLTLDPAELIDQAFVDRRVQRALELRRRHIRESDAFRLLHGEGDFFPGVVVDMYAGFAVLKLYSAGLNAFRPMIVDSLERLVPGLKGIIGRDEIDREGEEKPGRRLAGVEAPRPLTIQEHGLRFQVDVYAGQKTGFFVDQRENRLLIRHLARGRSVLNAFCFSGGFSVNAAIGGATKVCSIDQDADALRLAHENFTLNGLDPHAHEFLAAEVFQAIEQFRKRGRTFDLVILDPPAFAKSQKNVEAAIDGYASLNRQALALVAPGGLLATASCSARVSASAFMDAVRDGARNAGAELTLLEERYQPPDHPVRLEFPEGKYLKFFVLQKFDSSTASPANGSTLSS